MNMSNLLHRLFVAICLFVIWGGSQGQIEYPGQPSWDDVNLEEIPVERFPILDMETIQAGDSVTDAVKSAPWRFGMDYQVSWTPESHGVWRREGGERVWRMSVLCPDALAISFLLTQYELPKGARLFIWNAERTDVRGAFDHRNNKSWGSLALGQTAGEQVIIEYHEPLNPEFHGKLEIGEVIHAYRGLHRYAASQLQAERGPYGNSGDCNINVNCPEGATWATEKRSVALIISGNSAVCSGALVNNTFQDGTPYFLTANHCLGNPNNWTYVFNHESANCSGNTGPTSDEISGGTLVASNSASDVALIELSSMPPASYNVQYAGWDASGVVPDAVTCIHHPSGDVKKICFDVDGPNATNQGGAAVWYIDEWEEGVTEPGSSGSPLFDENHRIVGQLYGGFAACSGNVNNGLADWYGRFDVSWDAGNSPNNRLEDWLDPTGSGVTVLEGWPDGEVSFDVDAGIAVTNLPEEVLCGENAIEPIVSLTNMGSENLTQVTLQYALNGEEPEALNWTGNLAQYDSEDVALPVLTIFGGSNELVVEVLNPNGVLDENDLNNVFVEEIQAFEGPTHDFQFVLVLDDYGTETTWTLRRLGQIVYQGGGYDDGVDGEEHMYNWCLEEGCYIFRIEDSYGDGLCCGYGEGSWTILDPQGDIIATGGEFDELDQEQFCTDEMGTDRHNEFLDFDVYPNPTAGLLRLVLPAQNGEHIKGFQLFDPRGRLIETMMWPDGVQTATWNLGSPKEGVYFLTAISSSGMSRMKKVLIQN